VQSFCLVKPSDDNAGHTDAFEQPVEQLGAVQNLAKHRSGIVHLSPIITLRTNALVLERIGFIP
jgi:hypothetical protein